jgi:DMSO/TMAO reductase YedYZ molybdopterin-dependent catalytic subunit
MKTTGLVTRRRAIVAGLASLGGFALTRSVEELPPTYGHLLRMGDNLTYAAHRALLPDQALVREYDASAITSFPATGTTDPRVSLKGDLGDEYRRLQHGGFTDWRLSVEGRVATPRTFSLADLRRLRARTQVTRHTCEEGWTAIGQWTGVPLRAVLDAAGILPTARFVVFHSYDSGSTRST